MNNPNLKSDSTLLMCISADAAASYPILQLLCSCAPLLNCICVCCCCCCFNCLLLWLFFFFLLFPPLLKHCLFAIFLLLYVLIYYMVGKNYITTYIFKKLSLNNCYDVLITNYDLTSLKLLQCIYIYTHFDHL